MKIGFVEPSSSSNKADTLVFLVGEDKKLGTAAAALDKQAGGALSRTLAASGRFSAKKGQYITVNGSAKHRVVLAGAGKAAELDVLGLHKIGGGLVPYLNALGAQDVTIFADVKGKKFNAAAEIAFAMQLRSWRFDKYFTKQKPEDKPTLKSVNFAGGKDDAKAYQALAPLVQGVLFTRELVSEPANVIYPESLAKRCKDLTQVGVQVQVLGEKEMEKLGMGALLGVGQGSERESQMVIMRYNGGGKGAPIAFVGKGVTFDTGGISIKPAAGMDEMKWDMGGAGVVIGLMRTLAARKAKVNVVGVVGLVENMPDGNAQRPGDVVTSMSGQTIEVLNTDAEGRLVLGDALWYCQEKFKPQLIVDLATLTGAIIVALGSSRAGLFSNNDKLSKQLFDAGVAVGEPVWRLPLGDEYDKQINSDIADMQNIGKEREAGSITAAQFLQRFIQGNTPWAHLDIAGVAWSKKASDVAEKGATAFGVRLLDQLVRENYE